MQGLDFLRRRGAGREDLAGTREALVRVEVTTENHHQINIHTDVAFGCNVVARGAYRFL